VDRGSNSSQKETNKTVNEEGDTGAIDKGGEGGEEEETKKGATDSNTTSPTTPRPSPTVLANKSNE